MIQINIIIIVLNFRTICKGNLVLNICMLINQLIVIVIICQIIQLNMIFIDIVIIVNWNNVVISCPELSIKLYFFSFVFLFFFFFFFVCFFLFYAFLLCDIYICVHIIQKHHQYKHSSMSKVRH